MNDKSKEDTPYIVICFRIVIVALVSVSIASIAIGIIADMGSHSCADDECVFVVQTPIIPATIQTVTNVVRNELDTCPKSLFRYDRDDDNHLSSFELKVVETDFFYKRLTPVETKDFVALIGYTPDICWNPPVTSTSDSKVYQSVGEVVTLDDYYSCGSQLEREGMTFETFMASDWNDDNQYELNKFDCSQMAAYNEWYLENSGYKTVIRVGKYDDGTGHAWILTDRDGTWLAYECTGCYWVYPDHATARMYEPYGYVVNPSFYTAGTEFDSIYDAEEYCSAYDNGVEYFVDEFGWWID